MKISVYNLGRKCLEEIEVPVVGVVENPTTGEETPVLGFKMMDDEKWNRLCEEQSRKHPEAYAEALKQIKSKKAINQG